MGLLDEVSDALDQAEAAACWEAVERLTAVRESHLKIVRLPGGEVVVESSVPSTDGYAVTTVERDALRAAVASLEAKQ